VVDEFGHSRQSLISYTWPWSANDSVGARPTVHGEAGQDRRTRVWSGGRCCPARAFNTTRARCSWCRPPLRTKVDRQRVVGAHRLAPENSPRF